MINKKVTEYKNFGKCLEISNGVVKVLVTLDIGPRVINFSYIDGKNIMFEDVDRRFVLSHDGMAEHFGDDKFYIYGGHRLWTSPETKPRTFYPDNVPISYRETEKGAIFTPPEQKWNQCGFEIEIEMEESAPCVKVHHRITNKSPWEISFAPWCVTVLSPGGTEIVPQPARQTQPLSNRRIALWPYAKMNSPLLTWGDKYILMRQDTSERNMFKFGINCEDGYSMYLNEGLLFIKRFEHVLGGAYPDGGMSFETYENELFLEMESLGEYKPIAPGATARHTEHWSLYNDSIPSFDEKEIDKLVNKYII